MIASATQRMRGLLRSMPPTVTLPTWDATVFPKTLIGEEPEFSDFDFPKNF